MTGSAQIDHQGNQTRATAGRQSAAFDAYWRDYDALVDRSIGFAGRDHSFYVAAKATQLLRLVDQWVGEPSQQRALDVGCGAGVSHRYLKAFSRLEAVDVSQAMIDRAKDMNPHVAYRVADAAALPFENATFDVASATTVLHHVQPSQWRTCMQELGRVTRPGGLAVVFEHNPFNPLTRFAVSRCEFDDDAELLSRRTSVRLMEAVGLEVVEARFILLTPSTGRFARRLERAAGRLPFGAQYYVAGMPRGRT